MKSNYGSFVEFAEEVERIEQQHQDFVVPTDLMRMESPSSIAFGGGSYELTDHAAGQVCDRLQIGRKFWDRTTEYPGLRENIVNQMFDQKPERRMVRTIDTNARAFVSDRFRTIDNHTVMTALLPTFKEYPELKFNSHSLTDRRLYLQVSFPELEYQVFPNDHSRRDDVVRAGVTISNSEVGAGAVNVSLTIWRLVCNNGLIVENLMRTNHVGRRIDEVGDDYSIFKEDTVAADIESYRLRMRDTVANALDQSRFERHLATLREAGEDQIQDNQVDQVIENVTKHFGLPDSAQRPMLLTMARENHLDRYGLVNSITEYAQSIEDRDRQFELEAIGAKVLTTPTSQWIKEAAA